MAKLSNKDAVWATVDPTTLDATCAAAYETYKDLYRRMKGARETFEKEMSNVVAPPIGKRVIFGYNFGKLSIAIVDGEPAKSKPATGTQSLADWIATQRSANRSV